MKPGRLLIWILVLAAAGGLYFWSLKAEQSRETALDRTNRVAALDDPLNVQALELSGRYYPKAVTIVRRDKEHHWWITAPVNWAADNLAVGRLIGDVLDARTAGRVKGEADPADFGLKPPRVKLTLTDRKGVKSVLLAGDLSPTRKFLYASRPGGPVLMIPSEIRGALFRTVLDLRDKAALDFVAADVDRLEMTWRDAPAVKVLRKRGGADPRWEFEGGDLASADNVEDLLFQIHGLMAVDFLDQGVDEAKMGLKRPWGRVVLGLEGGDRKGLVLGGPTGTAGERYVRRLSGGPVMVLKQLSLDRLRRTRKQLAERRLWRVDATNVVALAVTGGGRTMAFAKEQGRWRRTQPPGDLRTGDPGAMLVYDLADLKWERILEPGGDYGLQPPKVSITLKVDLGAEAKKAGGGVVKEMKLYLGTVDPKSGLLPARVEGDGRIFGISPSFLKSVPGQDKKKPSSKGG